MKINWRGDWTNIGLIVVGIATGIIAILAQTATLWILLCWILIAISSRIELISLDIEIRSLKKSLKHREIK